MESKDGPKEGTADVKRCGFYVKRKRRHCRMIPAKGNNFCAEHLCHQQSSNVGVEHNKEIVECSNISIKKRVPCPLDPNHTVFEERLEKHLKKCNSRHKKQQEYFEENINSGLICCEGLQFEKVPLMKIPEDEIFQLIEKVNNFYSHSNVIIKENFGTHEILCKEIGKIEYGESSRKHLLQQASLINILEQNKVLKGDMAFVELGAGKGKFSHWVQKAMDGIQNVDFFLVDRQNHRNKFDCYHKGEDQGPSFQRLYVDIEHLNLDKVNNLIGKSIVGIGKHLCGGATDLALRCLVEKREESAADLPAKKPKVEKCSKKIQLILIALCCYHKCTWPSFVGREFLTENGFNEIDFHRMTQMCSWAVCGHHRLSSENDTSDLAKDGVSTSTQNERSGILNFSSSEKTEIGLKCKRIIDLGRCSYLKNCGYEAELLFYVKSDVTLENVALLAKPRGIS